MFYLLTLILAYLFMEFVAWFSHKYLMHGLLWKIHKDHHVNYHKRKRGFERNDLFFLLFAIPAIVLLMTGVLKLNFYLIAAGTGITLYGITYFILHDVFVHKRLPVFKRSGSQYFAALFRAHEAHHKPKNREDFSCFGLLVFPWRYFKIN